MQKSFSKLISSRKHEEEVSDEFLTSMIRASHGHNDDNYSSSSDYFHSHDTDSLSEDSKKIRKKRNPYQKISDETRVKLLEAVQNGGTLKAAAKRYNINYSSAKSILHTYRKEGRILKKSMQGRALKKMPGINTKEEEECYKITKAQMEEVSEASDIEENSYEPIPYAAQTEFNYAAQYQQEDDRTTNNQEVYEESQEGRYMSIFSGITTEDLLKSSQEQATDGFFDPMAQPALIATSYENFFAKDSEENLENELEEKTERDYLDDKKLGLSDPALQTKTSQNENYYCEPNAFLFEGGLKGEKELKIEDNDENAFNYALQSPVDIQNFFREERKASWCLYDSGYRKGSFDLF